VKHSFLMGSGLAVATVLVTPWNAVAATNPSSHSTVSGAHPTAKSPSAPKASNSPGTHRSSTTQADPIVNGCDFTQTPTTWTLTANCTATATISIPDGVTLNGAGHTITAEGNFTGAVVTNAGAVMSIQDLTIQGTNFPSNICSGSLTGVLFTNARGSVSNVTVRGMTRHNGCQEGIGIWVNATGAHQTVTITGTTVSDFQKSGLVANADATVNVSGSTFGPPDLLPGVIAQNTVQYSRGAGGTFTNNKVIGATSGRDDAPSTGMLLFEAANLTVTDNVISGAGLDVGILVQDSTSVSIARNDISRGPAPDGFESHFGIGVLVDEDSTQVSLTGNTFSGWEENRINAPQDPYILTTTLPDGTVGKAYSAELVAIAEDPASDLTWKVISGSLPPGLRLKSDEAIVGTPTHVGVFRFRLQLHDRVDDTTSSRDFTITIHPADVFLHVTKTAFPDPAAAGQPITFTITVFNGGPDTALGVIVHDQLPAGFTGFTWTCTASAAPSRCSRASGSGPISAAPVDIAARSAIVFRLHGTVPAGFSSIRNTATVTPGPGTDDMAPPADGEATVTVPVGPALPLTGPDLLPEVVGGTGLVALGGLILLPTLRRKRRPDARAS
jgi:uncharacterized repeat protein (TIGR01451 family)